MVLSSMEPAEDSISRTKQSPEEGGQLGDLVAVVCLMHVNTALETQITGKQDSQAPCSCFLPLLAAHGMG